MQLSRLYSSWKFLPILAGLLLSASSSALAQSALLPHSQTSAAGVRSSASESSRKTNNEAVTIPARAVLSSDVLSVSLDQGDSLESEHRWGEAIAHYERALRSHPRSRSLQNRMNEAKLHYSLDRRFRDPSFNRSVATLDARTVAQLYAEILLKVNAHYVSTPHWDQLVENGNKSLEIALHDKSFRQRHLPRVSDSAIAQFQRQIRAVAHSTPVRTRHDARRMVERIAALGQRSLGLSETSILFEYIAGATGGLDDYSAYLTADQLKEVYSQIDGNFVGLGVELKADRGALLIVHVIPGSPALEAGIHNGDRIVAVEGRTTEELSTDAAASMLQGPEGSRVTLTINRPGKTEALQVSVRRRHVEVPSVENVHIVDHDFGIGYIRLPAFQKSTTQDLDAALWKLHREGMRSLILDLRGNPGGLLTASVEVSDKFIQQGGIVSTRGRSPHEDYNYQAHQAGTWRVPLVVLIDGDSASASEIFAGAIRDHDRGVVVGQISYGKGSVQGIFPLGFAGAGLRLTTAKFYSPSGKAISKAGVQPHIVVQNTAKPVAGSDLAQSNRDEVLRRAVEEAKGLIAAR